MNIALLKVAQIFFFSLPGHLSLFFFLEGWHCGRKQLLFSRVTDSNDTSQLSVLTVNKTLELETDREGNKSFLGAGSIL